MKKLISLLLTLTLCLSCMLPAIAEEPAAEPEASAVPTIELPVSLEAYKAAYEAIIKANAPDCTVSWQSQEQNGSMIWMASINDSFVGLMVLADGDNVAEIACLVQGTLNENNLLTFLSMGGYGGAALLHHTGMTESEASALFMNELFAFFTTMTSGEQPESICGLAGGMSITQLDETNYRYYFILKLDAAAQEPTASVEE